MLAMKILTKDLEKVLEANGRVPLLTGRWDRETALTGTIKGVTHRIPKAWAPAGVDRVAPPYFLPIPLPDTYCLDVFAMP